MARNSVTVRVFLLVWLSMAQVFAPLLHAHWGQEGAPSVVHLPGLERYYHLGNHPQLDSSAPLQDLEGMVVRADEGVVGNSPQAPAVAAVLGPLPSPEREVLASFLHLSPSLRFLLNDLLPRAPPA